MDQNRFLQKANLILNQARTVLQEVLDADDDITLSQEFIGDDETMTKEITTKTPREDKRTMMNPLDFEREYTERLEKDTIIQIATLSRRSEREASVFLKRVLYGDDWKRQSVLRRKVDVFIDASDPNSFELPAAVLLPRLREQNPAPRLEIVPRGGDELNSLDQLPSPGADNLKSTTGKVCDLVTALGQQKAKLRGMIAERESKKQRLVDQLSRLSAA